MKATYAAIAGSFCFLPLMLLAQIGSPQMHVSSKRDARHSVPWKFVEDFRGGIRGWMSFPLAQDIGYDPTLYTMQQGGQFSLVRDVTAAGERELHVGLIRSIRFRLLPQAVVRLRYRVASTGRPGPLRFAAAGVSGKQYAVSIPSAPGKHECTLSGVALGAPQFGDEIEALAMEETVADAAVGSHSRLIVDDLEIDAERPSSPALQSPAVEAPTADGLPVADVVVTADHHQLPLKLDGAGGDTTVTLFQGDGRQAGQFVLKRGPIDLGASFSPGLWRAHVSSAAGDSDFRFLALQAVPPHPRLLLTPERLSYLRSGPPSHALATLVEQRAEQAARTISLNPAAGNNILRMPPDALFPGLTQYFDLLDHYGDAIALNALDYRLRGSRKSLEEARLALLAAARWPTWTPPWFEAHGLHSYYESGIFAEKAALGYDLIADELSPEDKRVIADAFYRQAIEPVVLDYFTDDRMPMADSNHMAHSLAGAISACLAVYGDAPDWATRFGPALAKLIAAYEHLLQDMFPGDGSEAESISYQEFAMEALTMSSSALLRAGVRPAGTERMLASYAWPYYAQYKPGYELDTGDDLGAMPLHSGFAWAAEVADDPALLSFYQEAAKHTLATLFRDGKEVLPGFADLTCCKLETSTPPSLPLSRIFPARGSAVLRSGWSDDATVISLRVGPWINHGHHDEGSFQVAAAGEILVGEAGYTEYYNDPRFENYFTQAAGHNTVLIDHDPFSQQGLESSHWKALAHCPMFSHSLLTDGMDFLEADLQPAYPDSGLTHYTREFLFLKPGLLFIHDSLSSRTAHTFGFLLHPAAGIDPKLDRTNAFLAGSHTSAHIVAAGANSSWHIEPAPISVKAYTEFDTTAVQARSTLHLESAASQTADFAIGIHVVSNPAMQDDLKPLSTRNAEGFSAEASGVQVLFRKGKGDLVLGGYTTDGTVLATSTVDGKQEIFAANARRFRGAESIAFTTQAQLDAALTHTANADHWQMSCTQATSMLLESSAPVKSAEVDGRTLPLPPDHHSFQLHFEQGEHRVDFAY